MHVLVCDQLIVNNSCPSGFKSLLLSEVTPQLMTLEQFYGVLPHTLVFLAICWGYRYLRYSL